MNDRIRELANQVERIRDLYNIGPVHRDAVEQFAELIVKECARVATEQGDTAEHSFTATRAKWFRLGAIKSATMIKRTFGVNDANT